MSSAPLNVQSETCSRGLAQTRRPRIDRQSFELRIRAEVEQRVAQCGADTQITPGALMDLAWDYFVAGFAAGAQVDRDVDPCIESVSGDPLADLVAALSPRRFEVLQLVARGLTNREIGEILGISSYTVKSHLAGLFESLEVTNRTEAASALQRYDEVYNEARSN